MDEETKPAESSLDTTNTETKTATETTSPSLSPSGETSHVASVSPPPKSKKRLLIIALVLLLVAAGAGYALMMKDSKKTDSETTAIIKKEIPLLKIGIAEGLPGSLLSLLPERGTDSYTFYFIMQTHEGLVGWKDNTQLVPRIAKSWSNPDHLTWDFELEQNRVFHTGKKLTAADVKASLDAMKGLDSWATLLGSIKEVTVLGDYKVRVTTKRPDAVILNKLASVPIYDTATKPEDAGTSGTGPYTVKPGTTPSGAELDLVADENYPLGKPYAKEIRVRDLGEDDKLQTSLTDGTSDIITATQMTEKDAVSKGLSYHANKVSGVTSIFLNNRTPNGIMNNKTLRQAVSLALDTEVLSKLGVPGIVANQIIGDNVPGFNPQIPPHEYNPAKAKQLIKEAGYEGKFTMSFGYITPIQDAVGLAIVQNLEAVGIKVDKKPVDPDTWEAAIESATEGYDGVIYGEASEINDLSDVAWLVASPDNGAGQYHNTEINALIDEANNTFDRGQRLALLQKISKTIVDDYGVIPDKIAVLPYVHKSNLVIPTDLASSSIVLPAYLNTIYSTK